MATSETPDAVHEHSRSVFHRLMSSGKRVEECIRVIAFWMWLDSRGFQNIITNLSSRHDEFLAIVYDEAVAILSSLQSISSTLSPNLMRNTLTLAQRFLSPSAILSDKENVLNTINDICRETCCVLFKDFLKKEGLELGTVGEDETIKEKSEGHGPSGEGGSNEKIISSGIADNWSHSNAGGTEVSVPSSSSSASSNLNPNAAEWNPKNERVPEEDRCLFLTFSNGFPLTENQIVNFFTNIYGPCVERVYVHRPYSRNQRMEPPLFGKVVFKTFYVPAVILKGKSEAKFWVDGKPLWCKRFNLDKRTANT